MRFSPHQPNPEQDEVIASLGEANLIRKPDLRYALVGGSQADRAEAEKWIALYVKYETVQGCAHKPEPKL